MNTGVDYAVLIVNTRKLRTDNVHILKAWIAIFTYFATKAVYLKLTIELSIESFLAVL